MTDTVDRLAIVNDLTTAGKAMGLVAQDDTLFRALVDAFRAADRESFQQLLDRFKIREWDLVCAWLRSKETVLECLELCGVPRQSITLEEIPRFAAAVARVSADEELIERLADAITDRNAADFAALAKELEIEPFCHLLCHWALLVRWRLVCEVVCSPVPIVQPDFVDALATARAAVHALANA